MQVKINCQLFLDKFIIMREGGIVDVFKFL